MSISYTKVKDSSLLRKGMLYGAKEYYRFTIDPTTTNQLALPPDYQFSQCFLPKKYLTLANRVHNFKVYPDDIWTVSYPKAGTTWVINVVWLLKNNLDFDTNLVDASFRYLERALFYELNDDNKNDEGFRAAKTEFDQKLDEYDNLTPPRILKSHLPAYLLPKDIWTTKAKLIYVYRNAKDVAVSMYHMFHNHLWLRYTGTIEEFLDAFLNDHIVYGPFNDHINSFQQLSRLDHVLLIKYEDMIADSFACVKAISTFLNCSYSDFQLKQLTEHLSFDSMRTKNQGFQKCLFNGFK